MLPWPSEVLAGRLSRNLGYRPDGLELVVHSVDVVANGKDVDLVLSVNASSRSLRPPQRWRVAFPTTDSALSQLDHLDTFVLIYRAALEEWWDVRGYEPQTAQRGIRIR